MERDQLQDRGIQQEFNHVRTELRCLPQVCKQGQADRKYWPLPPLPLERKVLREAEGLLWTPTAKWDSGEEEESAGFLWRAHSHFTVARAGHPGLSKDSRCRTSQAWGRGEGLCLGCLVHRGLE